MNTYNNIQIGRFVCNFITSDNNKSSLDTIKKLSVKDWNKLQQFLINNKLVPLFYSKLIQLNQHSKKGSRTLSPKYITQDLQKKYLYYSSEFIRYRHTLKTILKEFSTHNIDTIVLKGAFITEKYYDNPVLRPMDDIDILVKDEDIKKASEIILKEGYSSNKTHDLNHYHKFYKHLPIFTANGKPSIELHLKLHAPMSFMKTGISIEDVWSLAIPSSLCGEKCLCMLSEELILHLCSHALENSFRQELIHLYDIVLIIESSKVCWKSLFKKAEKYKLTKTVFSTLYCIDKYFNLAIPELIFSKYKPNDFDLTLELNLETNLFSDNSLSETNLNTHKKHRVITEILSQAETKTGLEKIKYLINEFFSYEKLDFHYNIKYKSGIMYYYYLKRSIDLLRKYSKEFIILSLLKNNIKSYLIKEQSKIISLENWLIK